MNGLEFLRKRPETFWTQLGIGLTMVAWGIYVIGYNVSMLQTPVYDDFVKFVPAWAWARIWIFVGLFQASVAIAGMKWQFMRNAPRRVAGLVSMLCWKVMAVSMINSGEDTPMAVVACGVALMNSPTVFLPLLRRV